MNREIEQLIHDAFHNGLSEADAQLLSEWITASQANARAYYRIVLLEKAIERGLDRDSVIEVSALVDQAGETPGGIDLQDLARSEDLASISLVELPEPAPQNAEPKPSRPQRQPGPTAPPPANAPVVSLLGVGVYRGGGITLTRLALAAGVVVAAVAGLMSWFNAPPEDRRPVAEVEAPADPPSTEQAVVAARVVSTIDVRWSDGEPRPAKNQLLIGDRVAIDEGYLTLRSARGARITVQGPCVMTAVGDNRFHIEHGRLIADIPPSAIYFTLDTPTARIVDYGTEFGVRVDEQGNTDAAVMDGLIELAEADHEKPGAAPQARRKVQLSVGWSSSVTADQGLQDQAVAFDQNNPDHFAYGLMHVADPTFRFRQAVIRSRPIAYWTFEKYVVNRIDNQVAPGRFSLSQHGRVDLEEGRFGKAARFVARGNANDYLRSSEPLDALAGRDQYAVSLWFKPSAQHRGRLVGLAAFDESNNLYRHVAVLETIADSVSTYKQPAPPNSARFLHRDPPGNELTGNNAYAPGVVPGRWHHLVAVKHLDRIEVYLNGERMKTVTDAGVIGGTPDVMIGLSHRIFQDVPADDERRRPFRGLIDEVAIYDRPLTADEIAEQYRLGSQ